MSLAWQYTIVGIVLGLCLALMLRGFIRLARRKQSSGHCSGCALSQTCNKPEKQSHKK